MTARVTGWKLDRGEREALLHDYPPSYDGAVADHVTLEVGGKALPDPVKAEIVGRTDDGKGVEAMVVTIDGTTDITWSLGPGRSAKESNDVLKERGWNELDHPIPVTLTPARF